MAVLPPADDIENNMVRLFKQGEKHGYRQLYHHYGPAILGVLTRSVKDQQLAEEYVCETFCKIWAERNNYDPARERLFTWMLKIAKSCLVPAAEKQFTAKIREEIDLVYGTDITAYLQEIRQQEGSSFASGIKEIIKDAIQLIYFESYSFAEAAQKLGLSEETLTGEVVKTIKQLKRSVAA